MDGRRASKQRRGREERTGKEIRGGAKGSQEERERERKETASVLGKLIHELHCCTGTVTGEDKDLPDEEPGTRQDLSRTANQDERRFFARAGDGTASRLSQSCYCVARKISVEQKVSQKAGAREGQLPSQKEKSKRRRRPRSLTGGWEGRQFLKRSKRREPRNALEADSLRKSTSSKRSCQTARRRYRKPSPSYRSSIPYLKSAATRSAHPPSQHHANSL